MIGIKRLNKPWFNDEVQCDVRGRMLNMIKSSYDYSTIFTLAKEFLADLAFGVKSRIYGPASAIRTTRYRQIKPPNKFIFSGLLQLGFIHTLMDLAGEKRLPAQFLSDLGIAARADALVAAGPGRRTEVEAALARLVSPDAMGALFKVMALASPGMGALPPFPQH